MDPRYDIKEVETRIYEAWERSGLFNPDVCVEKGVAKKDAEQFSIVLPPPNVTGSLHLGHAYEDAIQDVIVRFERMRGKRTLWVPSTDHAAIATQAKVEKEILKKEGKSRFDLGREEFLKRVNTFAQQSHDTIIKQVKRMGASLDWSREAYTLDEKRNLAVRTAFRKMYDLGLIYRGNRVINWDPKGQTVISDDEVTHEERKAKFYTFRYSKEFPISISTTRPETKVGDTAVAVHPADPRYKKFVGKEYDLDFVGVPLHIRVIADESVDKDFGTGALGVTPAHSMTDWEIAQKHKLPLIPVINERTQMIVEGPLKGMKTAAAREWIIEELRKRNLLEKEEEVTQNVSTSSRTGGIIEPLPKLQWFVDVNAKFAIRDSQLKGIKSGAKVTLKELMRKVVESGQIKMFPGRFEKVYLHWIENLRDWCISRQIWFGHRIPVWYCLNCEGVKIEPEITSRWFIIRHGETDWNKNKRFQGSTDIPLNETGIAQAKITAEALKAKKVNLVITSPLLRAKQTAEIIAKTCGAEIIVENDLRERNFGEWEGLGHEEIKSKYSEESFARRLDPDFKIPGGESWGEVAKRVWDIFQKHHSANGHKNVAIVGHGGVSRILQYKLKNIPISASVLVANAEAWEIERGEPCKKCGGNFYEQDPDTFDTWFSSGMWTFSTLGWPFDPAQGKPASVKGSSGPENDLANYHPTSLMNPGYEILFLWVARMILMSGCLLGRIPFRTVALHGLVRDSKGQKFSKSLGNGIDPLVLADQYGADAIRMGLIVGTALGNDVKFDEQKVKGYRNFSTKIWNVARFVHMNKPETRDKIQESRSDDERLKELDALKVEVTTHIENFEFHLAAEKLYHYIWHTLADKIVEAEKQKLRDGTDAEKSESYALLEHLLLESLKMLHPFMPFVTEEIWQKFLPFDPAPLDPTRDKQDKPGKMLMAEKWF
ncbi:MAG: class I tRNA ligase family protein [Candidatus Liptonbacteria bacterium]|nr:class I tRNA ligase family protein [Candidatus Liptonbacteria bacterium]